MIRRRFPLPLSLAFSLALFLALLGPVSLALASGGGGHEADSSAQTTNLIFRVLNFAILVGGLVFIARKYKLMGAVSGQVDGVRRTLAEAEAAEKEARARLAEAEEKMARLQAELEALTASSREQAERERKEILEEAGREMEKIQRDASLSLTQEGKRISEGLRAEVAGMVVRLAEETLSRNLNPDDRKRFVQRYLDQLEGMKR